MYIVTLRAVLKETKIKYNKTHYKIKQEKKDGYYTEYEGMRMDSGYFFEKESLMSVRLPNDVIRRYPVYEIDFLEGQEDTAKRELQRVILEDQDAKMTQKMKDFRVLAQNIFEGKEEEE